LHTDRPRASHRSSSLGVFVLNTASGDTGVPNDEAETRTSPSPQACHPADRPLGVADLVRLAHSACMSGRVDVCRGDSWCTRSRSIVFSASLRQPRLLGSLQELDSPCEVGGIVDGFARLDQSQCPLSLVCCQPFECVLIVWDAENGSKCRLIICF